MSDQTMLGDSASVDVDNDSSADGAEPATAETQLSDKGNAAPGDDQAPGENEGSDPEPSRFSPIERPRS